MISLNIVSSIYATACYEKLKQKQQFAFGLTFLFILSWTAIYHKALLHSVSKL
jgi:hypothetical protein